MTKEPALSRLSDVDDDEGELAAPTEANGTPPNGESIDLVGVVGGDVDNDCVRSLCDEESGDDDGAAALLSFMRPWAKLLMLLMLLVAAC